MVLHMESRYFFEATPPGDSYLTYLLSPPAPPEPINDHWTVEENKTFERCIAELDHLSRDFFENIALRIPRKSVPQIQRHYEALAVDIEIIESGRVPIPDYDESEEKKKKKKRKVEEKAKPSNEPVESESTQTPRRRGVTWSREEHEYDLLP